jgi:UDP-N-acetyl-D-galactosamine dehydrogenase
MGRYVAERTVHLMAIKGINPSGARALVLGLTFKENCPDLRNTRCVDIIEGLRDYRIDVDVHDPWVDQHEAERECGVIPVQHPALGNYDAIIIAVAHRQFREMGAAAIHALGKPRHVTFDVKYLLPADQSDGRL